MIIDLAVLQVLPHLTRAAYGALFLGMFVDANLTILAGAFLIPKQQFHSGVIFLIIIFGAFAEQFSLYWLGTFLGSRSRFGPWANRLTSRYDHHIVQKTFRSLLVSKFIFGLHRTVLIRCGMAKIGWQKFAKATLAATGIWLVAVFILGFVFSASYGALLPYFKYGPLALLGLLAVFFGLEYYLSRRLRTEL